MTKPFQGNTGSLNIDRGHLLPNGIYNQDLDAAKATFTLTNVAPQVFIVLSDWADCYSGIPIDQYGF